MGGNFLALIIMLLPWKRRVSVRLVESSATLKSCGFLINPCLSAGCLNLLDLEHGRRSTSAHEGVLFRNYWSLAC